MHPMKEHCGRCGMSFRVEEPPVKRYACRCAEPDCDIVFWHLARGNKAIVGIFPADAKRIEP